MNSETLTLKQIFTSLTVRQFYTICSLLISATGLIFTGGFYAGEYKSSEKLTRSESELKTMKDRNVNLVNKISEVELSNKELEFEAIERKKENLSLRNTLKRKNSCEFIQKQIMENQQKIETIQNTVILFQTNESKEEDRVEIIALRQQLSELYELIGGCRN